MPLFTNGVTDGMGRGLEAAAAAVQTIHLLAIVEVLCVMGGIAAVWFLPAAVNPQKES